MSDMKLRVDRAELADAAAWVAQAISKSPNLPILAGIRLTAVDGELTLAAFNYETSHQATLDADVLGDGQVVVSGRTFSQIVASVKTKVVELHEERGRLVVSAGRSTYRVGAMRVEDFPNMPDFPERIAVLSATRLGEAVALVEHAASRDPLLANLSAVNISSNADELAFGTTDRFRMARATMYAPDIPAGLKLDVPAASLHASLKGLSGEVTVGSSESTLGLDDGRRRVTTRRMDVEFPDYQRAMNSLKPTTTAEVDVADLLGAVKRALVLSDDVAGVDLTFADNEVSVTTDSDGGDAAEYVETVQDGDPISAKFNGRFLLELLNVIPSERVEIGLTESTAVKPAKFTPIDDDHAAFVLMSRRSIS